MRRVLYLLLFVFTCGLTATAQKVKPVEYGGSVNLIREIDKNTIVLRTLGYGKKEANAREDAEVRVIRAVLYIGFQGHSKLINESEAAFEQKHPDFITSFWDTKIYKDFITGIISVGSLSKVKGQKVKSMPFDVTVNVKALRQYLQQNNYGGRLGFGF